MSPHPTSWRSVLILPSHLRLSLVSRLFPSGPPTKALCAPLLCSVRHTCPTILILRDFRHPSNIFQKNENYFKWGLCLWHCVKYHILYCNRIFLQTPYLYLAGHHFGQNGVTYCNVILYWEIKQCSLT
jgi:hypothetical protein